MENGSDDFSRVRISVSDISLSLRINLSGFGVVVSPLRGKIDKSNNFSGAEVMATNPFSSG